MLSSAGMAESPDNPPASEQASLRIGEWIVDPRDDSLAREGEKFKIEPRTMRLLLRLARSPGSVVSQEELLDSVWSEVVVSPSSVYQAISLLRKVLQDSDETPRYIETVSRKGYRLVAPVALFESAPPAAPVAPVALRSVPSPRRRWWLPASMLAMLAVAAAFWWSRGSPPAPATIVVLPFLDLSADGAEQPFCDGLTDEVSNWLSQIPTLRVAARSSAQAFRRRGADAQSIARESSITHVVDGSLRRSGDRMRINVELVDARSGLRLWSNAYTVSVGDVLQVQEEVARSVMSNLELRMTAELEGRFATRRSRNATAQKYYLLALHHALQFTREDNGRAIDFYRRSIETDGDFAPALVGLANALMNQRYFDSRAIDEIATEAEPLLDRAQSLAPQLPDLFVARGLLATELRQRSQALDYLQRGLELNPNSVAAASALGFYHLTAAQPRDALTYYTMAASLDPLDFGMHVYRCMALTDLGQFSAAESECARGRALQPGSGWALGESAALEDARGNYLQAIRFSEQALARDAGVAELQALRARWFLRLGLPARAEQAYLAALRADPVAVNANVAVINIGAYCAAALRGARGLRAFLREHQLENDVPPRVLLELAGAALLARDMKLARSMVDRALASLALVEEDLASPWLARTGTAHLLVVAEVLRGSGDEKEAQRRLDEFDALSARLIDAGVRRAGLYRLNAQARAMHGDAEGAMDALRSAVELGWSEAWLADHWPAFDSLRGRADFRALLDAARERNSRAVSALPADSPG